jgi:uncharacterized membrane protein YkgB
VNVEILAHHLLRYGLVLILFWIGAMKFTAFEAKAIKPLVETSPFLSWMYRIFDLQTVSNIFGITEIAFGLMIGLRPISPRLTAFGSTAAVLMFLTTLTFLLSLPGWEPALGGFPHSQAPVASWSKISFCWELRFGLPEKPSTQ